MKQNFVQDDIVEIHSLGDGKTYQGKICGISSEYVDMDFYIVEVGNQFPDAKFSRVRNGLQFTHCVITESCLRKL